MEGINWRLAVQVGCLTCQTRRRGGGGGRVLLNCKWLCRRFFVPRGDFMKVLHGILWPRFNASGCVTTCDDDEDEDHHTYWL